MIMDQLNGQNGRSISLLVLNQPTIKKTKVLYFDKLLFSDFNPF